MVTGRTVQQYAQAACGYFARAESQSQTYRQLKNQLWTSFPGDIVVHDLVRKIKDAAETVVAAKQCHLAQPDSASAEEAFLNAVDALAKVTKELCTHVDSVRS